MMILGRDVNAVWDDSRRVTPGSLFAALSGPAQDGETFVADAAAKGAALIILSTAGAARYEPIFPSVRFAATDEPRRLFREAVAAFYGPSSAKVCVLGVTGTNGKTTITYFLESLLAAAGKSCGVVGTVNCRVGGRSIPSKNTTPGMLDNQIFLKSLAEDRVPYAVMEVSSHALDQGRVDLIDFRGALFTNLTGDHLDYHKTMEAYFAAKALLFKGLAPGAYAAINTDDEWGRQLVSLTPARVFTYGIDGEAMVRARVRESGLKGARFDVVFPGGQVEIRTPFTGKHNVYNILAAFAAGLGEGLSPVVIKKGIEQLTNVPGRLERVDAGQPFEVFIDYAHTDDGLKNVLQALQEVRHKKLIVVFGCGGDRDRTKRPRMGRIAGDLADWSIVTSDNPRSEDPQQIIDEVLPGFVRKNYETVVDREEAIRRALAIAQAGDIVLLAGKGHETYQVLKDRTVDFVERDIVVRFIESGE